MSGLLADSSSARDIADALERIVADDALRARLAEGARATMAARPTWDDVFLGLVADYEALHRHDAVAALMERRPIEAGVL